MACTSIQSVSSRSPSSAPSYDVFLSFRGADTRKTFTGHLFVALQQAGIQTFGDDSDLQMNEQLQSELKKAIQDSYISIVVFSKNYASSRWCLDELVQIMECKRTRGQTVIPVFYDVDPSDVRHQTRNFANHRTWSVDKVENWRAALTEAANISGFVLKDDANGHEAVLIQKIVDVVLLEVYREDRNVAKYLVGIDSRVKDLYPQLFTGSNDVCTLGIYGMGGIGKTTLAKTIFDRASRKFESRCFLANVREVSNQPDGLLLLQEQLIFALLKTKKFKVDRVERGLSLIKETIRSKRVLLILDDLDNLSQLEALAGEWNWFGSGSRIIITTRDVGLLDKSQVALRYEVKGLDNCESLELFSKHAFRHTAPLEDFVELSKDIISYVGGLPLALEVMGSFLFKKSMKEWKNAFEKLQQIPNQELLKNQKISFESLDCTVKNIFLDIACFFIGMDTYDAVKIMEDCGFSAQYGIDILRKSSLLIVDRENKLRMHNMIRDMGREIVRNESPNNPGKRSRLWRYKDVCHVLKNFKGTETIEGIKLEMTMPENDHLSTRTFEKMPNLRLLHISKVYFTGSFENLFKELRWLCWHYSPLEFLPSNFHPPELVFLDMQYSKVKILWHHIKPLQNLKILNVSHSPFLKTTPDFGGLEKLEKLLLRNCSSLEQVHPSIGLLSKLSHLDLNGCFNLNQLPEQLGNLEGLEKLDASGANIEQISDSIGHLYKLVELNLEGCRNLRTLPSTICHLTSLEVLSLDSCLKLKNLPENLGNMQCLRQLDVSRTSFEQLPDSIGHLSKLVKLNLEGCEYIRNLPSTICHLTSLEVLSLDSCSKLVNLPENLGNIQRLRQLDASRTAIGQLPDSVAHLSRLAKLNLEGCKNFRELPSSICHLTSLEVLSLESCSNLEMLPEKLGKMQCLSWLAINRTAIEQFPPNLFSLDLRNCSSLRSLSEFPPQLYNLHLSNCTSLVSVLKFPPALNLLDLTNCSSLQSLPELPPTLENIYAGGCTSLENLPILSGLKHLRSLNLENCSRLQSIKELPPNLYKLDLTNCSSLRSLPKLPPNLHDLNLTACSSLESLPDIPPDLECLTL